LIEFSLVVIQETNMDRYIAEGPPQRLSGLETLQPHGVLFSGKDYGVGVANGLISFTDLFQVFRGIPVVVGENDLMDLRGNAPCITADRSGICDAGKDKNRCFFCFQGSGVFYLAAGVNRFQVTVPDRGKEEVLVYFQVHPFGQVAHLNGFYPLRGAGYQDDLGTGPGRCRFTQSSAWQEHVFLDQPVIVNKQN